MTQPNQNGLAALTSILAEFEDTLHKERQALKALDYSGIDHSAKLKLDLQTRLEFQLRSSKDSLQTLETPQVESLKESLDQCRSMAQHNDALIVAYQEHIKNLQERLSGPKKVGYGPKRRFMAAPSCSQAVLTDSIG